MLLTDQFRPNIIERRKRNIFIENEYENDNNRNFLQRNKKNISVERLPKLENINTIFIDNNRPELKLKKIRIRNNSFYRVNNINCHKCRIQKSIILLYDKDNFIYYRLKNNNVVFISKCLQNRDKKKECNQKILRSDDFHNKAFNHYRCQEIISFNYNRENFCSPLFTSNRFINKGNNYFMGIKYIRKSQMIYYNEFNKNIQFNPNINYRYHPNNYNNSPNYIHNNHFNYNPNFEPYCDRNYQVNLRVKSHPNKNNINNINYFPHIINNPINQHYENKINLFQNNVQFFNHNKVVNNYLDNHFNRNEINAPMRNILIKNNQNVCNINIKQKISNSKFIFIQEMFLMKKHNIKAQI